MESDSEDEALCFNADIVVTALAADFPDSQDLFNVETQAVNMTDGESGVSEDDEVLFSLQTQPVPQTSTDPKAPSVPPPIDAAMDVSESDSDATDDELFCGTGSAAEAADNSQVNGESNDESDSDKSVEDVFNVPLSRQSSRSRVSTEFDASADTQVLNRSEEVTPPVKKKRPTLLLTRDTPTLNSPFTSCLASDSADSQTKPSTQTIVDDSVNDSRLAVEDSDSDSCPPTQCFVNDSLSEHSDDELRGSPDLYNMQTQAVFTVPDSGSEKDDGEMFAAETQAVFSANSTNVEEEDMFAAETQASIHIPDNSAEDADMFSVETQAVFDVHSSSGQDDHVDMFSAETQAVFVDRSTEEEDIFAAQTQCSTNLAVDDVAGQEEDIFAAQTQAALGLHHSSMNVSDSEEEPLVLDSQDVYGVETQAVFNGTTVASSEDDEVVGAAEPYPQNLFVADTQPVYDKDSDTTEAQKTDALSSPHISPKSKRHPPDTPYTDYLPLLDALERTIVRKSERRSNATSVSFKMDNGSGPSEIMEAPADTAVSPFVGDTTTITAEKNAGADKEASPKVVKPRRSGSSTTATSATTRTVASRSGQESELSPSKSQSAIRKNKQQVRASQSMPHTKSTENMAKTSIISNNHSPKASLVRSSRTRTKTPKLLEYDSLKSKKASKRQAKKDNNKAVNVPESATNSSKLTECEQDKVSRNIDNCTPTIPVELGISLEAPAADVCVGDEPVSSEHTNVFKQVLNGSTDPNTFTPTSSTHPSERGRPKKNVNMPVSNDEQQPLCSAKSIDHSTEPSAEKCALAENRSPSVVSEALIGELDRKSRMAGNKDSLEGAMLKPNKSAPGEQNSKEKHEQRFDDQNKPEKMQMKPTDTSRSESPPVRTDVRVSLERIEAVVDSTNRLVETSVSDSEQVANSSSESKLSKVTVSRKSNKANKRVAKKNKNKTVDVPEDATNSALLTECEQDEITKCAAGASQDIGNNIPAIQGSKVSLSVEPPVDTGVCLESSEVEAPVADDCIGEEPVSSEHTKVLNGSTEPKTFTSATSKRPGKKRRPKKNVTMPVSNDEQKPLYSSTSIDDGTEPSAVKRAVTDNQPPSVLSEAHICELEQKSQIASKRDSLKGASLIPRGPSPGKQHFREKQEQRSDGQNEPEKTQKKLIDTSCSDSPPVQTAVRVSLERIETGATSTNRLAKASVSNPDSGQVANSSTESKLLKVTLGHKSDKTNVQSATSLLAKLSENNAMISDENGSAHFMMSVSTHHSQQQHKLKMDTNTVDSKVLTLETPTIDLSNNTDAVELETSNSARKMRRRNPTSKSLCNNTDVGHPDTKTSVKNQSVVKNHSKASTRSQRRVEPLIANAEKRDKPVESLQQANASVKNDEYEDNTQKSSVRNSKAVSSIQQQTNVISINKPNATNSQGKGSDQREERIVRHGRPKRNVTLEKQVTVLETKVSKSLQSDDCQNSAEASTITGNMQDQQSESVNHVDVPDDTHRSSVRDQKSKRIAATSVSSETHLCSKEIPSEAYSRTEGKNESKETVRPGRRLKKNDALKNQTTVLDTDAFKSLRSHRSQSGVSVEASTVTSNTQDKKVSPKQANAPTFTENCEDNPPKSSARSRRAKSKVTTSMMLETNEIPKELLSVANSQAEGSDETKSKTGRRGRRLIKKAGLENEKLLDTDGSKSLQSDDLQSEISADVNIGQSRRESRHHLVDVPDTTKSEQTLKLSGKEARVCLPPSSNTSILQTTRQKRKSKATNNRPSQDSDHPETTAAELSETENSAPPSKSTKTKPKRITKTVSKKSLRSATDTVTENNNVTHPIPNESVSSRLESADPTAPHSRTNSKSTKRKQSTEVVEQADHSDVTQSDVDLSLGTPSKQSRSSSRASYAGSTDCSRRQLIKVMFTGIANTAALEKMTTKLGCTMASDISKCTHLIANEAKRTMKFLCAISRGLSIVTSKWVEQSHKASKLLDVDNFLLVDRKSEKQHGFSLQSSLELARDNANGILHNCRIHVTKNTKPPAEELKEMVTAAGGKVCKTLPKLAADNLYVVSCDEDVRLYRPLLTAGYTVVSKEFILSGILRQSLEPENFFMT